MYVSHLPADRSEIYNNKKQSWASGGLCTSPRVLGVHYIESVAEFQIVKKLKIFFYHEEILF